MALPSKIETWQMIAPGKMERVAIDVPELKPGEALVQIAGCGICRSDVAAFFGETPTATPRTLGHEISGVIVAGDAELVGKEVIIPAVMPCNNCAICKTGRGNRCLAAKIPGYTMGIYGGNSSHIAVPAANLCYIRPDILKMVLNGIIQIEPFVRTMPMSRIKEAYETARRGGLTQRIVLIPDFE